MPWALSLLQVGIALLFVVAATGKVLQPGSLPDALSRSGVPARGAKVIGFVVPCLEYATAGGLVVLRGGALRAALVASGCVLGGFTLWMLWVMARRLSIGCACFGAGSTARVGLPGVLRNVGLVGAVVAAWILAGRAAPVIPQVSVWSLSTVLAFGLVVVLGEASWTVRARLDLTRSRPTSPL